MIAPEVQDVGTILRPQIPAFHRFAVDYISKAATDISLQEPSKFLQANFLCP